MREIEFSTMFEVGPNAGLGDAFFDAFSAHHQIRVNRLHIEWPDAWRQLVQFGLNSHGPDVSEIGTTWLGGLNSMEALRPFTAGECALLGDAEIHPQALWQACQSQQSNSLLAIPWTLDLRVVLYRQDWLREAHVDETTAFIDAVRFFDTLRKLEAAGHKAPLGLTTCKANSRLIHDLACWVWSAGGDLRSPDGQRMMLMDPRSRTGLEAYFGLNKFITPSADGLSEEQVFDAFLAGKIGVAVLPERTYPEAATNRSNAVAEVADNVGIAMLMQTPYIGGSALSIWRYSSDYQSALKLIQALTSLETWQMLIKQQHPFLPARMDALEHSPLGSMPDFPVIQKSLANGRSFRSGYRWSAVEGRMAVVVEQLWAALRANPELDIPREVEGRFFDLCERLDRTILASNS